MRRSIAALLAALALALATATSVAAAHNAGPCNDSDGDGSFSGAEYSAHHIVVLAPEQGLGSGGHIPGSHMGFSACLGVH